jgi:hypothetical protein
MLEGYGKVTEKSDWQLSSNSVNDVVVVWLAKVNEFVRVVKH